MATAPQSATVRDLAAAARAAIVARAEEYGWSDCPAEKVFDHVGDAPFPPQLLPPFVCLRWSPPRPGQHAGAGRLATPVLRTFYLTPATRYFADISGQSTLALEDDAGNPDHAHDQWEELVMDALHGKMLFDPGGTLLTREPVQWADGGDAVKAPEMDPGWRHSTLAFVVSYNAALTKDTRYGG